LPVGRYGTTAALLLLPLRRLRRLQSHPYLPDRLLLLLPVTSRAAAAALICCCCGRQQPLREMLLHVLHLAAVLVAAAE
jgi:hypothetical protein